MRISSIAFCALAAFVLVASIDAPSASAAPCPTSSPGKYAVKIETSPPGATIYVNDKSCMIGTSPWSGKLHAGDNALVIELAGYELQNKTVKVLKSRKAQTFFVPLVKKADPPKIDVKADADPKGVAGAQVWLDGEMKGQAPVVLTVTPGRHQLVLKKDGYESYETWITANENQTST